VFEPYFYILDEDGQTPIRATAEECALWLSTEHHRKIVDRTEVPARYDDEQDCTVSTVFLGLDHALALAPGKPVLWETMIFGGANHMYQERYSSYKDAKLGHTRALWIARGKDALEEVNGKAG